MSRSTTEAVDDSLIANKVTLALYSDKQVSGRGIAVEASQGIVELTGVVASAAEAQRAVQITQQVKGVKVVRSRLRVQEGRQEPAPRTPTSLLCKSLSWERHAPAWLLESGWSPALPGECPGTPVEIH